MVSGAGTIATDDDRVDGGGPDIDTRTARTRRRVTVELALLLAFVGLSIGSRWIDADRPMVLPALQALGASLVPTAGVAVLAAIARRWRLVAVAAALAALQLGLQLPWWMTGGQVVEAADDPLVVMTTNAAYGHVDTAELIAAIERHDVDVLTVLEATAQLRDALAAKGIGAALPHVVDRSYDGCVPVTLTDDVAPLDGCVSAAGTRSTAGIPCATRVCPPRATSTPATPTPRCGGSPRPGSTTPTARSAAARSPPGPASAASACRCCRCSTSTTCSSAGSASSTPVPCRWRAATTWRCGRRSVRPAGTPPAGRGERRLASDSARVPWRRETARAFGTLPS